MSATEKWHVGSDWSEMMAQFQKILGPDVILGGPPDSYLQNCEGLHREIPFVCRPKEEGDVYRFMELCRQWKIPYYPLSRGQNWGYGSSLPVHSPCIILDLQDLTKIKLDEELGIVSLQPGVTSQKLFEYLQGQQSQWMVPLTGAGPHGSLLGNALERGFGLNFICDHFASILSIKAILVDGTLYESRLSSMGAWRSDEVSKWKIGPYMEGLFGQSNFGVVLEVSVQLARTPSQIDLVVIKARQNQVSELVQFCRWCYHEFGANLSGCNFSNGARLQATVEDVEDAKDGEDAAEGPSTEKTLSPKETGLVRGIHKILGSELSDIAALIPIYVYAPHSKVISKIIQKKASSFQLKATKVSERRLELALSLKGFLDFAWLHTLWQRVDSLKQLVKLLKGVPSPFSLRIAYSADPKKNKTSHPAKDGVGLYWFAPIVRLKGEDFKLVIEIAEKVLPHFDQKVMWTFTILNSSLAEATIPIYFDPKNKDEQERALKCWEALFDECLKVGIAPYRYSINQMPRAQYRNEKLEQLQSKIKKVFDPEGLIAPGRYLTKNS